MAAIGMELLFDACVVRFNATAALKAVGRKLEWVDQSTRPWTEFEYLGKDTDDGFGDDIEMHTVRFTYHGKNLTVRKATTWLEQMTGAFDDFTGLVVSGFTTSGVNRLADTNPITKIEESGVFEASADYEFILHRDVLLPAVRGA